MSLASKMFLIAAFINFSLAVFQIIIGHNILWFFVDLVGFLAMMFFSAITA
jgi:hypothetical protein